jgi:hypothetical protein
MDAINLTGSTQAHKPGKTRIILSCQWRENDFMSFIDGMHVSGSRRFTKQLYRIYNTAYSDNDSQNVVLGSTQAWGTVLAMEIQC